MRPEITTRTKPKQAEVNAARIKRFEDFWPYYLREHGKPATRRIHFVGTSLVILSALLLLFTGNLVWLFILPVVGYAPAWFGHFFIEKNKPATFRYPFWSLYSDFRMYFLWLGGRLAEELQWAGAELEERKPF
jgi:hypothetical protein